MFGALIDCEVAQPLEERLRAHLDGCVECRSGWSAYERAMRLVQGVPREQAPPHLAKSIMRRLRRRRYFCHRSSEALQWNSRLPVEVIIPLLLAAGIAVWIMLSAL